MKGGVGTSPHRYEAGPVLAPPDRTRLGLIPGSSCAEGARRGVAGEPLTLTV